jgi:hypothetical protein
MSLFLCCRVQRACMTSKCQFVSPKPSLAAWRLYRSAPSNSACMPGSVNKINRPIMLRLSLHRRIIWFACSPCQTGPPVLCIPTVWPSSFTNAGQLGFGIVPKLLISTIAHEVPFARLTVRAIDGDGQWRAEFSLPQYSSNVDVPSAESGTKGSAIVPTKRYMFLYRFSFFCN